MPPSRRTILGTVAAATALGSGGCSALASPPSASFSGNVTTDEPLIAETDVSADEPYPHGYSAIITTEAEANERIHWAYVEEAAPPLRDELDATNYDSEFVAFFGLIVPESRQLQVDSKSMDGDTLRYTFELGHRTTGATGTSINTHFSRLDGRPPDGGVSFAVRY